MGLHPQVQKVLRMMEEKVQTPLEQLGVPEARKRYEAIVQTMSKADKKARTEERKLKGYKNEISVRLYIPENFTTAGALVYYHGGGWVVGSTQSHDALCHMIAVESGCIVVSVDYGLAPENKFPIPVEDAYTAAKWTYDHAEQLEVNRACIAVGGDSAGGNLAAAVCYLAIQRKTPKIAYQLLLYPSTSFERTESLEKYGTGYYLTKERMAWYREQYLSGSDDVRNPLAAPMLIPEFITGRMPPAYIMTAEFDPLRDEGKSFAIKLKEAGVPVNYVCYPGMIHGFLVMTEFIDDGKKAITEIASELKSRFTEMEKF